MNYRGRGIYKHYKGNEYRVLGLGRLEAKGGHSTRYVIYEREGLEKCWLRPLHDFKDVVIVGGRKRFETRKIVPRFEWVGPLMEDPPKYLINESTGEVTLVDSAARQLAEDVMSIAETAGIPSSFYHTDERLLRAQAILDDVRKED